MDEQLRSLERRAAVGDHLAQERLLRERQRAGIPTGIIVKKLTGPGSILDRAVEAWLGKVLDHRSDTTRYLHFLQAISERHGIEFASYCMSAWIHHGGNLPEVIRAMRAGAEEKDERIVKLGQSFKEALDPR